MLDQSIRSAILVLAEQGHSIRAIARAVRVARDTVKRVLAAGTPTVPEVPRPEKAKVHQEEILAFCETNAIPASTSAPETARRRSTRSISPPPPERP